MVRQVLQTGLEVELEDHLGDEPYDPAGRTSGNSRNGSTPKTVSTEIGDIQTHLAEIYDTEISRETISKITDRIVDDMLAWQSRPLRVCGDRREPRR
jgi:putative transposase